MYGNSVDEAKRLFKYICEKEGISSVKVKSDPSLTVDMMGENKGFLSVWMIKAEEYWSILSDKKMWSASYKVEPDSVCGLSVCDNDSDLNFSDKERDGLPISLRFLFCRFALRDILEINNNMAFIKEDTRIYYNYNEDDDTLELLDRSSLQRLSYVSMMGMMKDALDIVSKKVPVSDYNNYIEDEKSKIKSDIDLRNEQSPDY